MHLSRYFRADTDRYGSRIQEPKQLLLVRSHKSLIKCQTRVLVKIRAWKLGQKNKGLLHNYSSPAAFVVCLWSRHKHTRVAQIIIFGLRYKSKFRFKETLNQTIISNRLWVTKNINQYCLESGILWIKKDGKATCITYEIILPTLMHMTDTLIDLLCI